MATTEPGTLNQQLLAAAKENDLSKVTQLLDLKANAGYQYHADGTWGASEDDCPLHHSIKHQNVAMTKLLLQKGANTGAKFGSTDWRGCGSLTTVFDLACSREDPAFLRLFLEHGADPNLQTTSTTHSMRTDGSSTSSLIHSAIGSRSVEKVRALLKAGANPNAESKERYHNERGYHRTTALPALALACELHDAAVRGTIALSLLEHKADPNTASVRTTHVDNPAAKDSSTDDPREGGYISPVLCVLTYATPLHLAIERKDFNLAYSLLLRGADPAIDLETTEGGRPRRDPRPNRIIIGLTPAPQPKPEDLRHGVKTTAQLIDESLVGDDAAALHAVIQSPPTIEGIKNASSSCHRS